MISLSSLAFIVLLIITILLALSMVNQTVNDVLNQSISFVLNILDKATSCIIPRSFKQSVKKAITQTTNYIFYKSNPIFQIFYFFIVIGGYLLFAYQNMPDLINQSNNQSNNQAIKQSISQSIYQFVTQLVGLGVNQPVNRIVNQSGNQTFRQSLYQSIDQTINLPYDSILRPMSFVFICFCLFTYVWLCSTSAGSINQSINQADAQTNDQSTKQSKDQSNNQTIYQSIKKAYPFDNVLYKPGIECPTCNIEKPARSKHCSVCNTCIMKMDHHCIWINRCVGALNHRHFFLFLITHVMFCVYAMYVIYTCMYQHIGQSVFFNQSINQSFNRAINQSFPKAQLVSWDKMAIAQYMIVYQSINVGLFGLALLMCVLLFFFTSYHFFLISINQSTNERSKISEYISGRNLFLHWELVPFLKSEEALKKQLVQVQQELLELEPNLKNQHQSWTKQLIDSKQSNNQSSNQTIELSESDKKERIKKLFDEQDQSITQLKGLHARMTQMQSDDDTIAADPSNRRAPYKNIYDQGFFGNWRETIWPPVVYRDRPFQNHGKSE